MSKQSIVHGVLAAALVAFGGAPGPVNADDAEIYVNTRELPESSQPLVMFSLDYRSNLSSTVCQNGECDFLVEADLLPPQSSYTFFQMLRASLQLVLEPLSGVRIGLMLNHQDKNNCEGPGGIKANCANGGYIAMGFTELLEDDANGAKAMFNSVLATMPTPLSGSGSDPSHPYQGRELFYEFYRYLTGATVYNGYNGFISYDHNTGNNSINVTPEYAASWAGTPSERVNGFSWDPEIVQGEQVLDAATGTYSNVGSYISPLTNLGDCSKIFTVNFLFQVAQNESDSDTEITADIGVRRGSGPGGPFAPMIEYLNRTDLAPNVEGDQKVTSYFLGTEPQVRNNTFAAYATAGGSGSALPITDDPQDLVDVLTDVFKQILSVSTTFTAAALPVNSFDRAELLDDVFLALFQPQVDDFPVANSYWWGNIKKLRLAGLGSAEEALQFVDARDQPAIAADGRIRFDALTLWTDPNGLDVADAGRDPDDNAVAGRDGRSVNRGGSGHKTPGFPRVATYNPGAENPVTGGPLPEGPRRMFYDSGPTTLAALEATPEAATALQSAIGAADDIEALRVLKFMRGLDPIADTPEPIPLEWFTGSVIHSRPVPVNYGVRDGHTAENPLIYVAAGSNDGGFRFIRNTDDAGNEVGQEAWAFVPTEVMPNARRIVAQQGPEFSGESTIYGFDGPATLYVDDANGNGTIEPEEKAYLYAGLRRGGQAYYALDVTNPEDPALLWRIVAGETPGFEDLGLAFSQPRTGTINLASGPTPVVVFAGGYDRAYDDESVLPANPRGKGIYVVNGLTGELLRHVVHDGMLDSIPSTVAAVDTAGDGLLDRIYVGDLGGRVWRVDLTPSGTPAEWAASLLADLGRHAVSGVANDRRFFNPPDVVQSRIRVETGEATAEITRFHAVVIGTGDRENPLHNAPNNSLFMIRDLNFGILTEGDDTAYTIDDLTDITAQTQAGAVVPPESAGWVLQLETPGEKNLAPALTVGGTVFFTTFIPAGAGDTNICGPSEGTGRLYVVSLANGDPANNRDQAIGEDGTFDPDGRWLDIIAPGIPSEPIFLPNPGGGGPVPPGEPCEGENCPPDPCPGPNCPPQPCNVGVGMQLQSCPGAPRWRTYWYLDEDPVQ